jgi:hypothetical protein
VTLRVLAVLAAGALGALCVVGFALAALFEIQGFGTPRDIEPRIGRLALYALGLTASVGVPLALWRALLPQTAPGVVVVVGATLLALVVSLLGLGFAR